MKALQLKYKYHALALTILLAAYLFADKLTEVAYNISGWFL